MQDDERPEVHPYPEWRVLWDERGLTLSPGQIISWEELSAALRLDAHRGRGYRQFQRFRRELQDRRGLQLQPLKGDGYRVALPVEVPSLVRRRMEISTRHQRRAKRAAAAAIRSTETPDKPREILSGLLFHIARVEQLVRTEMRQLRAIASGTKPPTVTGMPRALPGK